MRVNLKTKKIFYFFVPVLFALFTSFLYFAIYRPVFNTTSFTNLFFVFFAGLGWGANIFLGDRGMVKLVYYYSAASVILPVFLFEFLKISPYDVYWHRVIILMILAANLWLIVINKRIKPIKDS